MSIKDFSLVSKLGEGAYSTVFKVRRSSDGGVYALKKVKLSNLSEKEAENALNEVRILASIDHPNIVAYKEAFLEVMQYANDGDLSRKIVEYKRKGAFFPETHVWSLLIQTLRGLRELHHMHILHRDIKCANLFLNSDGTVQLGDMNVSKLAANGLLYTQTGKEKVNIGTPYYASPEVWNEHPYDSKSDIWSLGCVVYEMAALEVPFKAEDMEGLAEAVTACNYSPIPTLYSKELSSVIAAMLQLKPKNRPSCDKLLKSNMVMRKVSELQLEARETNSMELLGTIYMPKKLQNLSDRLPRSKYEAGKSSVQKQYEYKERTNTLPKLDRILLEQEEIIRKKRLKSNSSDHSESKDQTKGHDRRHRLQIDIRNIYEGKHQVHDKKTQESVPRDKSQKVYERGRVQTKISYQEYKGLHNKAAHRY